MKLQIPGLTNEQNTIVTRATAAVAALFVIGAAAPLLKPVTQGVIGAAPLPMNQELVQLVHTDLIYNCDTDKLAEGDKTFDNVNLLNWKTADQFIAEDQGQPWEGVAEATVATLQAKCAG